MDRGRLIVTALLVALIAVLAPAGVSAEKMRVIQLKHRPAGEIIPLIRPLLGPEDALSGTDYRLIVRASDRNLKDIEHLLAQLDVAQRQLRITVEQRIADDLRHHFSLRRRESQDWRRGADQIAGKIPR
jgi:hypothetical protein